MIVGDSFCREPYLGWPNYFHQLIDPQAQQLDFLCKGIGGCSWWTVRKSLLEFQKDQPEKFKNIDLAIVIHPALQRLHVDMSSDELGVPIELPLSYTNSMISEPVLAISLFYKYLHSPEFFDWAYQQWLCEVETMLPANAEIIHWFTDSRTKLDGVRLRGHVIQPALADVQLAQWANTPTQKQRDAAEVEQQFVNHFTLENNKVIAQELFRMIKTNIWSFDTSKLHKL
jgi:hypothetical protein